MNVKRKLITYEMLLKKKEENIKLKEEKRKTKEKKLLKTKNELYTNKVSKANVYSYINKLYVLF